MMHEDVLANVEIQKVIDERDPFKLTQDMEPEFGMMLQYLQELNSKKKPDYKMLRSQFDVIKERKNLKLNLEWLGNSKGDASVKASGPQNDNFGKQSV